LTEEAVRRSFFGSPEFHRERAILRRIWLMRDKNMKYLGSMCLLVALAATPAAAVNCEQVRRYAATGRTPEDIAETMMFPVEEVKKCLQQAGPESATPAAAESGGK
jgi:hypothetical protein